jgi:hypothetical protein
MDGVCAKLEEVALYIERNAALVKSITPFPSRWRPHAGRLHNARIITNGCSLGLVRSSPRAARPGSQRKIDMSALIIRRARAGVRYIL